MKFSNQFLPHVIVLVLIIIAVLVCFIPCVVPYVKPSSGFAVYEGMDDEIKSNDMNQGIEKLKEEIEKGNVAASSQTIATLVPDAPVAPSMSESFLGNMFGGNTKTESFSVTSLFRGNTKTESFQPLASAPVGNYSEIIDQFSQVKTFGQDGVNGCVSSGLSNSKGYLCLTPDLISALKTRGGNAQG
jgi:hypothetical protein